MTLLVALATLTTVNAAENSPTRFDQLALRFEAAQKPAIQNMTGWTSGRCYSADAQNVAYGALLVTETRESDGRHGPVFDAPTTKLMVIGKGRSSKTASPTYFDHPDNVLRTQIRSIVDSYFASDAFSTVAEDESSLITLYSGVRYEYRSDAQYIYSRFFYPLEAVDSYCYYFKKIDQSEPAPARRGN